jgi:hypothetical protein
MPDQVQRDATLHDQRPATQTCPALPVMPTAISRQALDVGCVVEDELWALAAQFERYRLGAVQRAPGHDRSARAGRPGEGHFGDAGCRLSASPVSWPLPCTTLKIPGGTPPQRQARPAGELNGVSSEGFNTTALPAASAAPTFHEAITSGKFQGVIAPAYASGSAMVIPS